MGKYFFHPTIIIITVITQKIGFTGENPEDSTLTQLRILEWERKHKHLLCTVNTPINTQALYYKDKELRELGFNTEDFGVGDSLGMLLALEKEVHWFVNDVWRGCVRVEDYPLDTPMWGVLNVYAQCKQVKAEICTGKL